MSTDEFQQMWKAYDVKLEKSLRLNLRLFQEVQSQKAKSAIRSLILSRVIGIIIGIIYVLLLAFAFWYVRTQPVMAVSFGVFIICSVIAIGMYIRELGVIHSISYGDNIVDTQRKLAGIQSSIIRTLRICWVQLPFWATFFVSNELLRKGGTEFLVVEIPIVLFLTVAAVILYRNITVESLHTKKWITWWIRGTGIKSVARAMEFMQEIEAFKKEG
jgi:glucan phosphoethanolaminetransferase (alkaline phosphatase superfamily)